VFQRKQIHIFNKLHSAAVPKMKHISPIFTDCGKKNKRIKKILVNQSLQVPVVFQKVSGAC
jgi:hypothetical protein